MYFALFLSLASLAGFVDTCPGRIVILVRFLSSCGNLSGFYGLTAANRFTGPLFAPPIPVTDAEYEDIFD
jgi:hypothetical protein|tara:strand:+ start:1191 stop:1400 length:210 start_codon:yes stop_codon:yes gene_type:complete